MRREFPTALKEQARRLESAGSFYNVGEKRKDQFKRAPMAVPVMVELSISMYCTFHLAAYSAT